jgi:hypothetical protein
MFNSQSPHLDSNYGSAVDIWAPYTTWIGPDPDNAGVHVKSGTSIATPFAAGIGVLTVAACPTLDAAQLQNVMETTGHSSPSGRVNRYVNARAAVLEALIRCGVAPFSLEITSPENGETFSAGNISVSLNARAFDIEEGSINDVEWTSDREGPIGSEAFSAHIFRVPGRHVITASASGPSGSASDRVTITIVNDPPLMTITTPTDRQTFERSDDIPLSGTSYDPNDLAALPDDQVGWFLDGTDLPFAIGHSALIPGGRLSLGSHFVDFVGDDGSDVGRARVTVEIIADTGGGRAPTCSITAPPNGASWTADELDGDQWFKRVELIGGATDPEDGDLTGGQLEWSERVNGGPSQLLGTGSPLEVRLFAPEPFGNTHEIRLTATDSDGRQCTFTIVVNVSLFA